MQITSSQNSIQNLVPCHWHWISSGFSLKKNNVFYSHSFSLNTSWTFMIHYLVGLSWTPWVLQWGSLYSQTKGEDLSGSCPLCFHAHTSRMWLPGNGSCGCGCSGDFLGKFSWGNHNIGVMWISPRMVRWWCNTKHNPAVAPWLMFKRKKWDDSTLNLCFISKISKFAIHWFGFYIRK